MDKKTQFNIWYWIAAFLGLMVFQYLFAAATQVAQIPYSEFQTYLTQGRIAEDAFSATSRVASPNRLTAGRCSSPPASSPI